MTKRFIYKVKVSNRDTHAKLSAIATMLPYFENKYTEQMFK